MYVVVYQYAIVCLQPTSPQRPAWMRTAVLTFHVTPPSLWNAFVENAHALTVCKFCLIVFIFEFT